ncbi:membrane protein [Gordonia phage SpeedDemon]|nr:membrane protein [Gordonia phage SpeedDemon]
MSPRSYTKFVVLPALSACWIAVFFWAPDDWSAGGVVMAAFLYLIAGFALFITRTLRVSYAEVPKPPVKGPPEGYATWGQFLVHAPADEVRAVLERGRR